MKKSIYDTTLWESQPKKIAILVPTKDVVYSHFSFSLANIIKTSVQSGLDVDVFFDQSTILINQREYLVNKAIESHSDYMFWMDSDMYLPSTTILRLLAHNEDIVCGNYMKRAPQFKTVAYTDTTDWDSWVPLVKEDELVEVEGVGLGCCLMKTDIFKKLKRPFFEYNYQPKTKDWGGEDFMLQKKLREQGYKIYLDMVLSEQVKHIGTFAFGDKMSTNQRKIKERYSGNTTI
jgi:hypothetical protein